MGKNIRWIEGSLGLLLPGVWLAGTAWLYAWIPGFRGSIFAFALVLFLAFLSTGAATLSAPMRWGRRLCCACVLWVCLIIHIGVILAWAYFSMSFGTRQQNFQATVDWMKPLESAWGTQSPGKPYSIQIVPPVSNSTEDCLRFELRKGEFYADLFGKMSFRSEVNARDFPPIDSIRWYRFSLLLPKDFPIEDNRLILTQWHGADKKYLGEVSRSPTLAFRYSGGRFFITMRHSANRIIRDASRVPSETFFETDQFPLGEWHDFLVNAKWSYRDDGYINVWWEGRQVVSYAGPVGYNDDFGPYFKFGVYRDDSDKTYVVYFSQVKIGDRLQDITTPDPKFSGN
jgi:hypothetical protein